MIIISSPGFYEFPQKAAIYKNRSKKAGIVGKSTDHYDDKDDCDDNDDDN